jgi:hypothetical protein
VVFSAGGDGGRRSPEHLASKLTEFQRREALQRLADGEAYADVARTYGVDPTTIGRLAKSTIGRLARSVA